MGESDDDDGSAGQRVKTGTRDVGMIAVGKSGDVVSVGSGRGGRGGEIRGGNEVGGVSMPGASGILIDGSSTGFWMLVVGGKGKREVGSQKGDGETMGTI